MLYDLPKAPCDGLLQAALKDCARAGKKKVTEQTRPPTVPVADLFPSGVFPEGERQSYGEE